MNVVRTNVGTGKKIRPDQTRPEGVHCIALRLQVDSRASQLCRHQWCLSACTGAGCIMHEMEGSFQCISISVGSLITSLVLAHPTWPILWYPPAPLPLLHKRKGEMIRIPASGESRSSSSNKVVKKYCKMNFFLT